MKLQTIQFKLILAKCEAESKQKEKYDPATKATLLEQFIYLFTSQVPTNFKKKSWK